MDSQKKLEKYIRDNKLRHTGERSSMLDYIIGLDGHFTLEMLIEGFGVPNHVSRASVYRNLNLFVDAGLVVEHPFPGEVRVFELMERAVTHYHRVCTKCGAVKEFKDMKTNKTLKSHRFRGFSMQSNHVYIYGVCSKCRDNK